MSFWKGFFYVSCFINKWVVFLFRLFFRKKIYSFCSVNVSLFSHFSCCYTFDAFKKILATSFRIHSTMVWCFRTTISICTVGLVAATSCKRKFFRLLIYGQTNHIQKENLLLIPNTSPYGLLCILLIVLVDSKERFFIVLNSYEYFSLIPYTVWLPLAREGLCL